MIHDVAGDPPPVDVAGLAEAGWRIVAASVQGPAHAAGAKPREDAFAIGIVAAAALVVVCDGAGSASCAAAGAAGFSRAVLDALSAAVAADAFTLSVFRAAIVDGVEQHRQTILARGLSLRDHHATLVALAALPSRTLIGHVGDGLAGVAAAGDWPQAELSAPENGQFANETFFVTEENWSERLRCVEASALRPGGAAVVLTDGAMPFVVGPDQTGLEPDFMAPVSRFLGTAEICAAAEALAGTLGSAEARQISSDDKTLVWVAPGETLSGILGRLAWSR